MRAFFVAGGGGDYMYTTSPPTSLPVFGSFLRTTTVFSSTLFMLSGSNVFLL